MKIKSFNLIAILIFSTVVVIIGWNIVSDNRHGHYITVSPEIVAIEKRLSVPGHVYPVKEVEIKSQLSGVVDSILVETGDIVETGDPIANIRLVPNLSDIEQLENNLRITKIELDALELSYKRNLDLFENNAISKEDMETTEKSYLISKEKYNTAMNQLAIMRYGYSSSSGESNMVTASTSGTVIDIPVENGTSVIERNNYNVGTTIAILAEMDRFIFKAKVPEQNLVYMMPGRNVRLTFNAYDDIVIDAIVTKVAAKGEEIGTSMRFMVEAEFALSADMPMLRSGYSATAEFIAEKRDSTLAIKEKNIKFRNDSSYVFVFDSVSGKYSRRAIHTGISDGEYIEITGGLTLTDKIITNIDDNDTDD